MNLDSLSDDDFKELLNKNHPELVVESIVRMNTGWSTYTFDVNGQYIFRFPRFEVVKNDHLKEMRLLPSLSKHMSIQVPNFEFIDREVPYVGYKKIQGVPIVECDLSSDKLAKHLASVLLELHSFPVEKALVLNVHLSDWRNEYEDLFTRSCSKVFLHLDSKTRELATEVFNDFLSDGRNFEFSPSLIHRDLSGEEHILCNPETNQITGIIDWEDSCIGDPAIDFTGLFWDCGEKFTRSVLRHYENMGGRGPKVDQTFWERNLFYGKMVAFNITIHGQDTHNEGIFRLGLEKVKMAMIREVK